MKEAVHYLEYIKSRGVKSVSKTKTVNRTVVEKSNAKTPSAATATPTLTEIKPLMEGFLSFDPGTEKFNSLDEVKSYIGDCRKCRLHELRKNIVVGEGNPNAKLMFIGEGPGEDEDNSGRPFVGRAGQLLTKIIEAMKLTRDDVYIANIVKCRPPNNRAPSEDEVIGCVPYLMKQISVLKPKVIVTLGASSTCALFNQKVKISAVRGNFYDWKDGIKLLPTFHPAYLLRNPIDKKLVWEDMQKVMEFLSIK
jgi:DNA polymerase